MRFSIIIPIYNVAAYLPQCLDSVVRQSCQDFEVICVDDGSKDDSFQVARGIIGGKGNWHLIHQENQGLSSARNTGLAHSTGDYVLFLDSDDWLEPNALEVLASNLDGEDMLCFSGRRFFESDGQYRLPDHLEQRRYPSGMEYYNDNALVRRDFAFVCVVLRLYKRSFLLENGLRFKEGILHEDDLFTPQACCYARNVRVIDDCLYDYRVRANSITTTRSLKRVVDLMSTANELAAFFISKEGFDKTVAYRSVTHHYQVVFLEVSAADKKKIRRMCDWHSYWKVSRTKPRHRVNYLKNRLGL